MSNAETVQAIYEAIGRGDVTTILDKLDDAAEWETTAPISDVPWLRARRGKASIVGFFESMAPLEITRFEPHTIFDGGDKVFALIKFEATARDRTQAEPESPRARGRGRFPDSECARYLGALIRSLGRLAAAPIAGPGCPAPWRS